MGVVVSESRLNNLITGYADKLPELPEGIATGS